VEIVGGWPRHPAVERPIRAAVAAVAMDPAVASFLPAEATLALSTDAQVRALNRGWRGKDNPTNVLSFPTPPGTPTAPGIPPFVGDVVLALETVEAEAHDMGLAFEHHVQHLVVHGLLHLFGFDHEDDVMAAEMEGLETRILAAIGVADPYAKS
jgi:probable rRNA maturation factor